MIFRILFGLYLTIHFYNLIPYANELFSNNGLIDDPSLNPTYHIIPNILSVIEPRTFVQILSVLSASFTLGCYYDYYILILWYGWMCLLNRNVFIANPGIPYVGWLLLACFFIQRNKENYRKIFWCGWFLMGMGYTISGLHKLQCPSWIDGSALYHILNSPLANDNIIRDILLSSPAIILKIHTWLSLFLEISFLPLGMFYHTRLWFWCIYMIFHIGILLLINFTDLTLGVLMIHFFTFDTEWIIKN